MNKAYALSRFNSDHLFAALKYNLLPPPPPPPPPPRSTQVTACLQLLDEAFEAFGEID